MVEKRMVADNLPNPTGRPVNEQRYLFGGASLTKARAIKWLKWSLFFILIAHFRVLSLKDGADLPNALINASVQLHRCSTLLHTFPQFPVFQSKIVFLQVLQTSKRVSAINYCRGVWNEILNIAIFFNYFCLQVPVLKCLNGQGKAQWICRVQVSVQHS